LDLLIKTTGWQQREWAQHFGVSPGTVRRVRRGGRPKIQLLRRLRELERDHERELEAYKEGLIMRYGQRLRYCWVEFGESNRQAEATR
jgi:hypothetical protein